MQFDASKMRRALTETEAEPEPKPDPAEPTPGLDGEEEFVRCELEITARMISLGHFRGLDGKALTIAEAKERMARSERYLRWRWRETHV